MDTLATATVLGLVLAAWSFLFAILEIAIEGPVGWALTAPTWRKRSRLYALLMNGKELTGYHAAMFFLPLLLLHLPFVFITYWWGISLWSLPFECELLAAYFLLAVHWDFLWFVLNPHFGTKRFRKGEIWWHAKWVGRVPTDYLGAVGLALAFTAMSHFLGAGIGAWARFASVVSVLVATLVAAILIAPAFHAWYQRRCDDYLLVTEDWQPWLTVEELVDLKAMLQTMESARRYVAAAGRLRAQREQLGRPKLAVVRGGAKPPPMAS